MLVPEMVPNLKLSCTFTHKQPWWAILASNKRTSDVGGHNFHSSHISDQVLPLAGHWLPLRHQPQWNRACLDGVIGQDCYLLVVALIESENMGSIRGKSLSYLLFQNYSWHLWLVALSWFFPAGLPPDGIPGFIWDALNLTFATEQIIQNCYEGGKCLMQNRALT